MTSVKSISATPRRFSCASSNLKILRATDIKSVPGAVGNIRVVKFPRFGGAVQVGDSSRNRGACKVALFVMKRLEVTGGRIALMQIVPTLHVAEDLPIRLAQRRAHSELLTVLAENNCAVLTALFRTMCDVGRPTDDAAVEDVEHDGQIEDAAIRRDIGYIRDAEPIRRRGHEATLDQIRGGRASEGQPLRLWRSLDLAHADELGLLHWARDALLPDTFAYRAEIWEHPWSATCPVRSRTVALQLRQQDLIKLGTRGGPAAAPFVATALGKSEDAAHRGNGEAGLV